MDAADALDAEDLPTATCGPHEMALSALDDPEGGASAAVAWCSAHLVATQRVLYAAAARRLPDGTRRTRVLRSVDHRLLQSVCRLDHKLTGDAQLCSVSVAALGNEVRTLLEEHAQAEGRLVAELMTVLDEQEQTQLAQRLAKAMRCAPTRPHPHTGHLPLGALVARLDACVDRVRDLMDNRVVPTPHAPRAARVPGRWASYLMGTPYPTVPESTPAARTRSDT